MAKTLILLGVALILAGILWHFGLLRWVGKLPGDIRIEKQGFAFYFPVTTCILFSVLAALAIQIIRFFGRGS